MWMSCDFWGCGCVMWCEWEDCEHEQVLLCGYVLILHSGVRTHQELLAQSLPAVQPLTIHETLTTPDYTYMIWVCHEILAELYSLHECYCRARGFSTLLYSHRSKTNLLFWEYGTLSTLFSGNCLGSWLIHGLIIEQSQWCTSG